jgi:hypothetical protein
MTDTAPTTRLPAWVVLTQARERLADVEQRHFSNAVHLDELKAAYVALQQAERAVVEAGT